MPDNQQTTTPPEGIIINEAQFLLARKRTQLAEARTGLAVLAVPLSIISLLIVTSRFYHIQANLWFLFPLVAVCLGLVALGGTLFIGSFIHLRRTTKELNRLVAKSPRLCQFNS